MIVFPNCKINIGLRVVQKRSDGFHDIETFFYPVPLKDALEAVHTSPDQPGTVPNLYVHGLNIDGNPSDNLCVQAWNLLKKDYPTLPAVDIHLLKNIPMGAGLGGGSADGAWMLQLLNNKFHLQLSTASLAEYALKLGSDCPFFLLNQPAIGRGRGEILEQIPVSLSGFQLALLLPGIHINTGWAFSQLLPDVKKVNKLPPLATCLQQPVATWRECIFNDFELPVFAAHPELAVYKNLLYQEGAVYAAMSGSGSTLYGLFEKNKSISLNIPVTVRVMNLP